jgi:cytochrome P450
MHYYEPWMPVGPLLAPLKIGKPLPGIQWVPAHYESGFWLVSDYKMAKKVLSDQRFRRSDAVSRDAPNIFPYNPSSDAIISLEGAEHSRIRRLVNPMFTERRTAELTSFVERSVADLLDGLEAQKTPADFVSHVSTPLPFGVLCHLLGIPPCDREIFGSWVNVLFRLDGDRAVARQHSISLARYMMQVITEKRREPSADLISELITSAEGTGGITNRELVTLCLSLLMAGFDSTADQITLCVLSTIMDRPLMRALSYSPELIPRVAEEFLRLNPAPYITFPRMAVEPVSIGGEVIDAGQQVIVFLMGANRDTSAFVLADEVALKGPIPGHLTFGHGAHRCLGAPLARLQLTTLLTELVRRFPDLELAEDLSSLSWKEGTGTRGLRQLYVVSRRA